MGRGLSGSWETPASMDDRGNRRGHRYHKKEWHNLMEDPAVRAHFVEEMADVLMFYSDILLCFDIPSEDLKRTYTEKFQRNMNRW